MKYKGREIGTPKFEHVKDFIEIKRMDISPEEVYMYYTKKQWLTKSGRPIKTLESAINVWNSLQTMAKMNGRGHKLKSGDSKLTGYSSNNYAVDVAHLSRLGKISTSRRAWIETTMLELRSKAPIYEHFLAEFLFANNIQFIHQAPFILDDKIYFADFFIPAKHAIIEVDGGYHNGCVQATKDRFRDLCFNGHMIRVIRIPNSATDNKNDLCLLLNSILM